MGHVARIRILIFLGKSEQKEKFRGRLIINYDNYNNY